MKFLVELFLKSHYVNTQKIEIFRRIVLKICNRLVIHEDHQTFRDKSTMSLRLLFICALSDISQKFSLLAVRYYIIIHTELLMKRMQGISIWTVFPWSICIRVHCHFTPAILSKACPDLHIVYFVFQYRYSIESELVLILWPWQLTCCKEW